MKKLWSCSTTMRNPERAYQFLSTIAEMEDREWTESAQEELQARLIKNFFYTPTKLENLPTKLQDALNNKTHLLSLEEATEIFNAQNYKDASIRGRVSFDPIEKMGLAGIIDNKIFITDMGRRFLSGEIEIGDVMLSYLLKFQYPNPLMRGFKDYNTKPFINTLRLIKYVNQKCQEQGKKAKGISKLEFGLFALTITDYKYVEQAAEKLLEFRSEMEKLDAQAQERYVKTFIHKYLSDFKNPEKNIHEYTDNIIRCLRLTKYIYIHGGGYYIDLEPRRMIEIDSILQDLSGEAQSFSLEGYYAYIGDYYGYTLPFESEKELQKIANAIKKDINELQRELKKETTTIEIKSDIKELKKQIDELRIERLSLQNEQLKYTYDDCSKIDEAKDALHNINKLGLKPSIALEKWANIALNIIDDAKLIKPNSPLGDDNEPTFTAPAKVPDIECYYESFQSICEVTMLKGRNQWFNEGQPVMRHLRDFENQNTSIPSYCLFVAPKIHQDTINTFWLSVKYEYEGSKQRIVPITIKELIDILEVIKEAKSKGIKVPHSEIMDFYNKCTDITGIADSTAWRKHIAKEIGYLKKKYA